MKSVGVLQTVLALVLLVTACGGKAKHDETKPTSAGASPCVQVADHMMSVLPPDAKPPADQLAKIHDLMVAQCTQDQWGTEIQQCILTSTGGNENRCAKLFSPAQVEGMKHMGEEIGKLDVKK
jgi:hypothetical protein